MLHCGRGCIHTFEFAIVFRGEWFSFALPHSPLGADQRGECGCGAGVVGDGCFGAGLSFQTMGIGCCRGGGLSV